MLYAMKWCIWLQGKRHPAEALLSPRDEEESGQRRYGRRGSEYVTPGPEAGSRGGRGRGRARGGRTARSDAPFPDFPVRGDQGLGAAQQLQPARGATQSGKGAEPVKAGKLAWKLFTADNKVRAQLSHTCCLCLHNSICALQVVV